MPFGRWKPRGQNGSGILKAMVDTIPISGIKKLSVSEKKTWFGLYRGSKFSGILCFF